MRILGTTAACALQLDVDRLAREVGIQQDTMHTQTGHMPCAVRLNSETRRQVMRHRPGPGMLPYWAPTVDGVKPNTFVGLALVTDESVPPGYATLEVCQGCLNASARCDYATWEALQ